MALQASLRQEADDRSGTFPLLQQATGKPIRFAGNVIKDLREAQAFEPPHSSRAAVSLRVIAVNHGAISMPGVAIVDYKESCP